MLIETKLCMGCMEEKDYAGECKKCGYSEDSVYMTSYLAPKSLLKGRYIVGKLISYNGEAGSYLGFDTEKKEKVIIKEFMPDALALRGRGEEALTVRQEHIALYKTYLSEFLELNRTLMNNESLGYIRKTSDVFTENNTAYAVMQKVEGMALSAYLSNIGGTMTWEQVKGMFPPILTMLGQLHGLGIIHRGISPSTIYVSEKSELKLLGFGITAGRTVGSELSCEVFGGYAAPEQYSPNERNGSWTDVYGIAAVLYCCLTGIVPENARTRQKEDKLQPPMMINSSIPRQVSDIIYKGLALKIDDRIQTISEFVDRLFEQPQGEMLVSKPRKPSEAPKKKAPEKRSGKKKKSNVPAIIALVFVGLLIVGFVVAIIVTSMREPEKQPEETTTAVTTTFATTTPPPETTPIETTEASPLDAANTIYIVPNLVERPYELIKDNPKYSFLTIITEYDFNDTYATGTVYEQSLEPKTEVVEGTEITVKISKGPSIVELPDYEGLSLIEYCKLLFDNNIKYEREAVKDSGLEPGTVIRCSLGKNNHVNVKNGQTVTVYYAAGEVEDEAETEAETEAEPAESEETDE